MMFVSGMEVDSVSDNHLLSPQDRIKERLIQCGVPKEQREQLQPGLLAFVKENKVKLHEIMYAILPTEEDIVKIILKTKEDHEGGAASKVPCVREHFRESIQWMQWLMFENEPRDSLKSLAKSSVGQRGVCGSVWGQNDIAYRCRTCEHDPTCAICVPCFQNGNHKGHDYSLMYTGGGCCDCGDETAWKREGFCSKHKGAEQIQPLAEDIANSVGPVLEVLLTIWKDKLLLAQSALHKSLVTGGDHIRDRVKVENDLSSVVVEMLLEFCKYSESLLSFVSRMVFSTVPLLDILVRAERFLNKQVVKKLHELLLKLLGDPVFKYEFAKVFIRYYPETIKETISESSDNVMDKYRLLSTFSVQIFTVPTLTPRLVKEMNLLGILLGCVEEIFLSCAGEEGHLQVSKWGNLYETTIRLVEDTRYVMSHVEVPKYVTHEQTDICKNWMRLLGFVQGMNPQKRVTGLHVEDENENMHMPFVLGHSIANIHSILVDGAFSVEETNDDTLLSSSIQNLGDSDGLRHAKVGRPLLQSSVCSTTGENDIPGGVLQVDEENLDNERSIPDSSSVTRLTYECLRAIENWLGYTPASTDPLNSLPPDVSVRALRNFLSLKNPLSRMRGKSISKSSKGPSAKGKVSTSSDLHALRGSSPLSSDLSISFWERESRMSSQDNSLEGTTDMDYELVSTTGCSDDSIMETECSTESKALGALSLPDWPDILYDVSSQDISVHIPLHRLLTLLLQKVLRRCYGESAVSSNSTSACPSSRHNNDFFGHVLRGCHPFGFSAFIMEHPLRIRVFCAQVRADMWRKNGDVAMLSCEWYRSVRWSEQGLEFDLFLLQCCAALAPPDLFVRRVLERFGLSNYLSLNPQQFNEYEPVLVQEMLILIIQIVKERRWCGLSTAESLRRELVYKLAIGDATHSQLMKSLPHDLSKNDQLQQILDTVAVYANPSGMKQGKYSLRKTCWEELDLYHPRWNSRDLQAAEERYLRFCKVSALTAQLPRWTKIFYPLTGISKIATSRVALEIVRAVLFYAAVSGKQSQSRAPDGIVLTALHLLSLALDICYLQKQPNDQSCIRTSSDVDNCLPMLVFASEGIAMGASNGSDSVKQKSLLSLLVSLMRVHEKDTLEAGQCNLSPLVANLLKKFAELNVGCLIELQRLAPELVSHLSYTIPNGAVNASSSISDAEGRKAKVRARQAAMMEQIKAAQTKFIESYNATENDEADVSESKELLNSNNNQVSKELAPVICSHCRDPDSKSPVSYLILLQKSRLTSFVERGSLSWEQLHLSDKEHRSITTNEVTNPSGHNILPSSPEMNSGSHLVQWVQNAVNEFAHDGLPSEVDAFLDFIKARLPVSRNFPRLSTSHDASIDASSSPEIMEDGIYQSILRDMQDGIYHDASIDIPTSHADEDFTKNSNAESLLGKYIASLSKETSQHAIVSKNSHKENASSKNSAFDGFGPTDCDGVHISSCGHAMHPECRDRYLLFLRERYVRRIVFEGGHVVDPDQGEFLCPVCRRFANSVLPAFPSDPSKTGKLMMLSDASSEPTVGSSVAFEINGLRLAQALSLLQNTANKVGKSGMQKAFSLQRNKRMQATLEPVFRTLCRMYFPDRHDNFSASGRVSPSMILWDTLKYSIISTEIAARSGRSNICTESSTSGLEALHRELESSSGFILSLLLRVVQSTRSENPLQVLLRFRASQLFAGSICSGASIDENQRGNISSVLKHVDKGVVYPDIQFWRRAADPVLAHDPFSSLMWILFSLPSPFLSNAKCFLYLIHLFYGVCLVQILITHCGKHQYDTTELGVGDCLIGDICKILRESTVAQQYFVSNYIDSSCHPKDMIRRLSYPYLRRCALLWKLLTSSTSAPFSDRSHELHRSSYSPNNDMLANTTCLSVELKEVEELEHMFQIPDLDVVLKDNMLRALGVKWFHHFCREYSIRNYGRALHSTPAVPFRLMGLPHVYQDLLERYIKQKCPECKAPLDDPALCLLCGRICSPSWKSCCRESGCQTHAMSCGAGIGVYLLIRKTTILLLRSARQAPWLSPYLDAFGEEDIDMHRGRPLFLNGERYAALTNMVASHGLDRSSEVLRQTTIDALFLI